ncbi:protein kinase [Streptomyces sp. NPDC005525]|uniref:serine/threonine-protein kinase n=1 Tax=Streptomyces sp. NPDC005525 TaxID=3364720 RepID=UPI0036971A55
MAGTGDTADRVIAGRYRLLRKLGAGGMGRVWLAHDQELASDVALKEIYVPPEMPEQELNARIARAQGEARHSARLRSNPHVVTVYDIVVDGGLPWIVMEFVPGEKDLEAVVRESGPLSPADTANLGLAVLDALTEGHQLGILHRDVKPSNILLADPDAQGDHPTGVGRVLLTDYGISLQQDSGEPRMTGTSGFIGTPGFLAPERARGVPPNPASDLFSLGATLYYAVEGNRPFDRTSDYSTLTALLFEEPPPPTRAGPLEPVLAGLMVKDPSQRMGADEAMRKLIELTAGAQVEPRRKQPPAASTETLLPLTRQPPRSVPSAGESHPSTVVTPQPQHRWKFKALSGGRILGLIAAVLLVVGGGIWGGTALLNRPDSKTAKTGPVLPYGDKVGLTRELRPGDCVFASWPRESFKDTPKLHKVDCKRYPDGQVLDVDPTTSLAQARTKGPGACVSLLRDVVRKMVDVRSFAVVPSSPGWDNGVRNTVCLLFGKTVSLYGPVAEYRKYGDQIFVENSSIGDCFNTKKLGENNYARLLVDCKKTHEEQVLGYVKAPQSLKFDSWDAMYDLCVKRYGSYKSPSRDLSGWNHEENTWNHGFRFVACVLTTSREGEKLPPVAA